MARSFLSELFLSTFGSMPSRYDPNVDSWWGIFLTEFGLSDPFREENVFYFLVNLLGAFIFALVLCALSLGNAFRNMRKERDEAREYSRKGAYEYCDLHNQFRDKENELYHAHERLQDATNGMDDERKELHDTIQNLNDQHVVDREEMRSMEQHVSNTECDRDEFERKLTYALRNIQTVERENIKLERENQQLVASLTEKNETINDLQAQKNNTTAEPFAAVSSSPKYIQINDETEMHQQMHQTRTTTPGLRDTAPEQAVAVGGLAERDERVHDLERRNGTLTSEVRDLRTDLDNLRDEHGKCSEDLPMQLTEKNEEIRTLRAEKKAADDDSAETVAALRVELGTKEQGLKAANEALVANQASSGEDTQRLETLTSELGALQRRVTDLQHDHEELQETHATGSEHAESQASQITQQLRDTNGLLQASNDDLSQQLERAKTEGADLIRERQRVEQQNQTLLTLRTSSQSGTLSLQAQIQGLTQRVDNQQQQIHTLRTNCPKCQDLRAALDAVAKDVTMSDDDSRAEMRREVTEELRSQAADDLRRHLRGEVERSLREEFRKHYSDLFERNSNRIQEQDRLIKEKDAKLEKAKTHLTIYVDHAACAKKEGNMLASITKLEQDAKILQGKCSRLNSNAQDDREELKNARTANGDLRAELETIKADQRRAQHINPLQGKLGACQRESERIKTDRDKARNNCSIYSKNLSELRKKYEALENEHLTLREKSSLDGDSQMEDGCNESLATGQNEKTIRTLQIEIARLSKELEDRKARDNAQDQAVQCSCAVPSNQVLPVDEGEQQGPEGSFPNDQSYTAPATNMDEAMALDVFRREVDLREARDGKKAAYPMPAASAGAPRVSEGILIQNSTQNSDSEADDKASLPIDEANKSDNGLEEGEILDTKIAPKSSPKPPGKLGFQHARLPGRQPTDKAVPRGIAGKKRERDTYSDGEADDEGGDDRKKVKTHHTKALGDRSAPVQGDKPQMDRGLE